METLDQDALNLTKAIRQHESGGNFNIQGKSGEYGAYQFTEPTWRGYAKEVLGDENAPMTPQNQNKVAYTKIKQWKDSGKNVGQIASMWNAGEGKPNAYIENNVGVNKYGVHYDTPTYAKKVAEIYQQLKGNQSINPNVSQETTVEPTLGSELKDRAGELSTGVNSLIQGKEKSGQSRLSGLIQTGGAIAGGIGDIVNKGLELIPGVKKIEGLIGQGIGSLAKTEVGKKVTSSMQEFSEKHPELSKDIGAGFNILTAIPIFKGLGLVKNVTLDATGSALKNIAEKSATKDLTHIVSRTVGGRKALQTSPDVVKTLIDERALPDIAQNKFTTKEAYDKLSESISKIEDTELQPALSKANVPQTSSRIPLEQYRKEALEEAKYQLKSPTGINDLFDRLKAKYGDYPTLKEMNEAKRLVSKNISEAGFTSPTYTTDKIVRSTLQKSIEDAAKILGLEDVASINQKMARLIKAQNILKFIEGKPVKTGLVGGLIKDTATVGGEMIGNTSGIPLAGAYLGREGGGFVGKKLAGISKGILNRTGKDATRVTKKDLKRKLPGLFAGMVNVKN